jgi:hypothetical protein
MFDNSMFYGFQFRDYDNLIVILKLFLDLFVSRTTITAKKKKSFIFLSRRRVIFPHSANLTMRKSRGGKVANNGSSMASNSACSHTTNADKSNLVATQEIKIRNLLKELQNNVRSCEVKTTFLLFFIVEIIKLTKF